jgi:hypothetical protein
MLAIATCTFDKIGSLRESPEGGFYLTAYVDAFIAYPEAKASAYHALMEEQRGPYSSVSQFYQAMADLNDHYVLLEPEIEPEEKETDRAMYREVGQLAPAFIVPALDHGPFVISHDDLAPQNILVSTP